MAKEGNSERRIVEPLMSHGQFYRCLCYVSETGNIAVVLLSMGRSESSRISSKISYLCSEAERRSKGLERHEGEQLITEFSFWGELTL